MALINTVKPEQAQGNIKEGYDLFLKRSGNIPQPFILLSASPGMFDLMMNRNQYFSDHPALPFSLLAHIRYFVSMRMNYKFCYNHNKRLLLNHGLEEMDFIRMDSDPDQALLDENERVMLEFVLKAMAEPELVIQADIDQLRGYGWEDRDIFDALAQGIGLIDHQFLMKVFKP